MYEIPFWLTFFFLLKPSCCIRLRFECTIADFIQLEVLQTSPYFQQPGSELYRGLQCTLGQNSRIGRVVERLWVWILDEADLGSTLNWSWINDLVFVRFSFLTFKVGSLCFLPPRAIKRNKWNNTHEAGK